MNGFRSRLAVAALLSILPALASCRRPASQAVLAAAPARVIPVAVRGAALVWPSEQCTNRFVAHDLGHTTTAGGAVKMYESNGAGLGIGDLDGDGRLDIVLANLTGGNTILWNDGAFHFHKELLDDTTSRSVSLVDVNGDGQLDIVFTHSTTAPTFWRNTGKAGIGSRFAEEPLPGIDGRAYSIAWGAPNRDGNLDAVTGSYDADLEKTFGYQFLRFREGGGVYYYRNAGGTFIGHRLAAKSEALAIAFADLEGDGRPDILVGNDFSTPDQVWRQMGGAWTEAHPFSRTTHSTMSFDLGDIDNSGRRALFATDMKPYDQTVRTLAEWRPMLERMPHDTFIGDPQIMENVLQIRDDAGVYHNEAYARALDATGWSWSAKFGDLDNDGFLDLYVVNGMLAEDLFDYLPGHELVEENRALRNGGKGDFTLMPAWGLGSKRSGRGMSMADLDGDGRLDIVVNNLESAAQVFENRLCGGSSLEVDLRWPESKNTRAIGAQLILHTDAGNYARDVRASSGYLSGDTARVHFGFPVGARPLRLEVQWPDGAQSVVNAPAPHSLLTLTR